MEKVGTLGEEDYANEKFEDENSENQSFKKSALLEA